MSTGVGQTTVLLAYKQMAAVVFWFYPIIMSTQRMLLAEHVRCCCMQRFISGDDFDASQLLGITCADYKP